MDKLIQIIRLGTKSASKALLIAFPLSIPAPAAAPDQWSVAAVSSSETLPPDITQQLATRRSQVIQWATVPTISANPKFGPYDVLIATAHDGCGTPDRAKYMTDLGRMGTDNKGFEMFALAPLVRYLYTYPKCMTDQQRSELIKGLTAVPRAYTAHGTMNHMVLQETSWYLLAQYFPDAHWKAANGVTLTSAQVMAETKDLLTRRHWRSFQSGMFEMFSTTYTMTNLFPILNIVDFAKDREMALNASKEASLEVAVLKANSFHGEIMPPLYRHNVDQWNAAMPKDWPTNASIGQQVLWFYFGEPQIGPTDLINRTHEPVFLIMLALSGWHPPVATWSMPTENYAIRTAIPTETHWDDPAVTTAFGDTWIGHDYTIATGNMLFDPTGYNDDHESFAVAFLSSEQRNLIECKQPFWRSNFGEDNWGFDGELWSPFLQTWRLDNHSAVLLASIPQSDPWPRVDLHEHPWDERSEHKDALLQMVECRIPKAVDKLVVEEHWAFVRKGNVSIGIGDLNGSFELTQRGLPQTVGPFYTVLKVREPKTALYVIVDDQGGDFAAFQARAKSSTPTYDDQAPSIASGTTTVTFAKPEPDPDHPNYWRALPIATIDGKVVPYTDSPAVATPFLRLADGTLTISGPHGISIHGPERPSTLRVPTQ